MDSDIKDAERPAAAPAADSRSRLWRRLVAGVVVLLVVGALAGLGWWWRHPTAFREYGGWGAGGKGRPGETHYFGVVYPDEVETAVQIDRVRAHVVSDTSATDIEFFLCNQGDEGGVGSGVQELVDDLCTSVVPVEGVSLLPGFEPPQALLIALTPRTRGVVVIEGIDITYHDGWQHGTQRTGGDVTLRTRAPKAGRGGG